MNSMVVAKIADKFVKEADKKRGYVIVGNVDGHATVCTNGYCLVSKEYYNPDSVEPVVIQDPLDYAQYNYIGTWRGRLGWALGKEPECMISIPEVFYKILKVYKNARLKKGKNVYIAMLGKDNIIVENKYEDLTGMRLTFSEGYNCIHTVKSDFSSIGINLWYLLAFKPRMLYVVNFADQNVISIIKSYRPEIANFEAILIAPEG